MMENGAATLYSRQDCPLCEEWLERLQQWPLNLRVRDIDADAELRRRYQWRVPVLRLQDGRDFDLALEDGAERAWKAITKER